MLLTRQHLLPGQVEDCSKEFNIPMDPILGSRARAFCEI
jgi:hypothetical protein